MIYVRLPISLENNLSSMYLDGSSLFFKNYTSFHWNVNYFYKGNIFHHVWNISFLAHKKESYFWIFLDFHIQTIIGITISCPMELRCTFS